MTTTAPKKAPAKKAAAKTAPEPRRQLTVWYVGNFRPEHSTENHVAEALRNVGAQVGGLQEDAGAFWEATQRIMAGAKPDFILWTRTRWSTDVHEANNAEARLMLRLARARHIPVVGYHLDIWWGLRRETEVSTEPFFDVDLLVTADGGHDDQWTKAGVNHLWMPPAISRRQAEVGTRRDEFRSPIAFVGSHDGGYHPEHAHRHELVRWLRQNFRRDCAFWPRPGQHAIRGADLQDLYASVDVVVGDSCFAGTGLNRYWSDRIPETIGRGGFLLHPNVPGLEDHFVDGEHLVTWDAFDWSGLGTLIETALSAPEDRRDITLTGRQHVLEHHTYEVRMCQLIEALVERGMVTR